MDVNDTRFHLLATELDWLRHVAASDAIAEDAVVWDRRRRRVSLRDLPVRFPVPGDVERFALAARRGAGRDRHGNWYTINESENGVDFLPAGRTGSQPYWTPDAAAPGTTPSPTQLAAGAFTECDEPEPAAPWRLRGLAVTTNAYVVVGVHAPRAGLLLFDLYGGGAPTLVPWPAVLDFRPWDIVAGPDGGAWILDGDPIGGGVGRLFAIDRYLRVVTEDQATIALGPGPGAGFAPAGGAVEQPATFPAGIPLSLDSLPQERTPIAVEALPDDSVLVLVIDADDGASWLYRFRAAQQLGAEVRLDELLEEYWDAGSLPGEDGFDPAWVAHDLAFVAGTSPVPGRVAGKVHVVGNDGRQAYSFALDAGPAALGLDVRDGYLPLRRFGGKGLVSADGDVHYDLADAWYRITETPTAEYLESGVTETSATIPFDGHEPDCTWHRILFDASIPAGTRLEVESRAANDADLLTAQTWEREPDPYLRAASSEVPYHEPFVSRGDQADGTGTWELLFQSARGRYLQLRLTFVGTRRNTPRVYAMRVHYPRFSYLREYLPSVYQDDADSASFLDRYLANVEGTFTELEGAVAQIQTLFDERTIDPTDLAWLASWVGLTLDPTLDVERQRLMIRHAVRIFAERGTLPGLIRALRLALDACPDDALFESNASCTGCAAGGIDRFGVRVIERFEMRRAAGVLSGDPTTLAEPPLLAESTWSVEQGVQPLHRLFRAFLASRYDSDAARAAVWGADLDAVRLSPVPPANAGQRADWERFVEHELPFTYEAPDQPGDDKLYRTFLVRRYRTAKRLSLAYQREFASFTAVTLPAEDDFPEAAARLDDWIQFVSLALPIHRYAHTFSVLVPTPPGELPLEQNERLAFVRRIVELEKPAHTEFEVKPYWALFRVGGVRVGLDTLVAEGSRYVAMLLGDVALADGHLAWTHPWNLTDRAIVGRDEPATGLTL